MVIDDEPDPRTAIADLLELNGYAVTQAGNGSDALSQLKLGSPAPSLILLDMAMPILDGKGFMQAILIYGSEEAHDLRGPDAAGLGGEVFSDRLGA